MKCGHLPSPSTSPSVSFSGLKGGPCKFLEEDTDSQGHLCPEWAELGAPGISEQVTGASQASALSWDMHGRLSKPALI